MTRVVLSPTAGADITAILAWTFSNFGEAATVRYEYLLEQALDDLGENPKRVGTTHRPEFGETVSTYHLRGSRRNVPARVGLVKQPRHFLLFRRKLDGVIEIVRVLHDGSDLVRHLPTDFDD